MYRDSYQGSLLTIFFANGQKPLLNWDIVIQDGTVSRYIHPDISTYVLELRSNNVSTTYMICPKGKQILGIAMPFLVMVVKNLHKYFSFEVTILDDTGVRRRFRVSNFQSKTQILPLSTAIPINLFPGWNQIQFNLAEFCSRAYQKQFAEVQKLKVNANIILRRIYFCQKLFDESELPKEYRLYLPIKNKSKLGKENIPPKETSLTERVASNLKEIPVLSKIQSTLKPKTSISLGDAPKRETNTVVEVFTKNVSVGKQQSSMIPIIDEPMANEQPVEMEDNKEKDFDKNLELSEKPEFLNIKEELADEYPLKSEVITDGGSGDKSEEKVTSVNDTKTSAENVELTEKTASVNDTNTIADNVELTEKAASVNVIKTSADNVELTEKAASINEIKKSAENVESTEKATSVNDIKTIAETQSAEAELLISQETYA